MKQFCERCYDFKNYYTKDVTLSKTLRGKEYSYSGKKTYCECCHSEIYVNEVLDSNIKNLYKVVNND